ncbi:MAG: presqualene diphosphate synthase HpnD [Gammaproteobacteria bacterium]|jgi:phytoene synthase
MTPDEYCQEKAASSGSSFYYSFLFLPPAQRKAITALYAFCREVDDIVDECSEPQIARVKLQWWRDTIRQTFAGDPQHPVQKALAEPINTFQLPLQHFLEIIDGMEMDLDHNRYATFKDLSLYCYRAASVVGLLAARIFGYQNPAVLDYAENLGMAFQLTNIIRDIKEDASRNRIYIPRDELQQFGVTEADILESQVNEAMTRLLKFQSERAKQYYDKAFHLLPEQDRYSQRSGLIMAAIYINTLQVIEKDNTRVLDGRISLTPIRKLWLAWTTARSEKKRHKKYLQTCRT